MINSNPAIAAHPINDLIKNRWSSLAFSEKPVEKEKVMSLLEAARWAPSSYNEQPWNYVVGYMGDETHKKLAECLAEGNSWAKTAPVLMLSIANLLFIINKSTNLHAIHDTGAASVSMALQATDMDMVMHQMGGYSKDIACENFNIGADHAPVAMIAIGYPGDAANLPESLKTRESAKRTRKPIEEIIWKQ